MRVNPSLIREACAAVDALQRADDTRLAHLYVQSLAALDLARRANDRRLTGRALLHCGRSAGAVEGLPQAAAFFMQALRIFRANQMTVEAADCLVDLARTLSNMSRERKAIAVARLALDEPGLSLAARSGALDTIALSALMLRDGETARHYLTLAGDAAARSGQAHAMADALHSRAWLNMLSFSHCQLRNLKGPPNVEALCNAARTELRDTDDLLARAQALSAGGYQARLITKQRLFLRLVTQGPVHAEPELRNFAAETAAGSPGCAAWALFGLGLSQQLRGRVDLALASYAEATALAARFGEATLLREISLEQCAAYQVLGDFKSALSASKAFSRLRIRSLLDLSDVSDNDETAMDLSRLLGSPASGDPQPGWLRNLEPASVRRACEYIATHLQQRIRVDDVAAHCAVSRRSLEMSFKEAKGYPVAEFVRRSKMERAQELLTQTTLSIQAIAKHLGFSSSAAFSRDFRALFGIAPSGCRQRGTVRLEEAALAAARAAAPLTYLGPERRARAPAGPLTTTE